MIRALPMGRARCIIPSIHCPPPPDKYKRRPETVDICILDINTLMFQHQFSGSWVWYLNSRGMGGIQPESHNCGVYDSRIRHLDVLRGSLVVFILLCTLELLLLELTHWTCITEFLSCWCHTYIAHRPK